MGVTQTVSLADDPSAAHQLACSIASTVEIIGDRWTILILRDAFRGIRRFDHFHRDLGVARNLLADRLAKLVEHGILDKSLYQNRPPRFEYRLTPKGVDLSPSLVALMHFGDKHLAGVAGPPVVLVHESCGDAVDQEFICWTCDCTVTPGQLRSRHPKTEGRP
jgi:DNA-binding HxlR family transcriptional regulator